MSNRYWVESLLSSMKNLPLGDFIEMCETAEFEFGPMARSLSKFMDAARLWITIKTTQEEEEKCLSKHTTLD